VEKSSSFVIPSEARNLIHLFSTESLGPMESRKLKKGCNGQMEDILRVCRTQLTEEGSQQKDEKMKE
jgi:hypothetical protein